MTSYLERFRAWWSGLAPREQRVLSAGALALGLILVYLALWEPVGKARHARERDLAAARALATRIESLASGRGAGSAAAVAGTGQSLLAVVDQSRRSSIAKPPSRLQPEGDNTVRIWLEDVPFDGLLRWLGELQTRYGVRVDNAEIERESGPGLVNARLTLMRG